MKGTGDWLIAAAAFVAIFAFQVPFPLIVLAAALIGAARGIASEQPAVERLPAAPTVTTARDTAMTISIWLAIWLVPLLALAAVLGPQHILAQLALFFSKLAVVTFGGAYAVLAYMAQDVVQAQRLAAARRDARCARPRRNDTRPADPGDGVRRLSSPGIGPAAGSVVMGIARCGGDVVGDVRAVLPVDLRRCAVHRADERASRA